MGATSNGWSRLEQLAGKIAYGGVGWGLYLEAYAIWRQSIEGRCSGQTDISFKQVFLARAHVFGQMPVFTVVES